MRVKLARPRQKLNGLTLIQKQMRSNVASRIMDIADVALTTAVSHTPKWSGAATEGWKLSLKGDSSGYEMNLSEFSPLEFPEGNQGSQAQAFNRRVIAKELKRIRLGVYAKVKWGKDVELTLTNTMAYAESWLSGSNNAAELLRSVNQDFYTWAEIKQEVNTWVRFQRMGRW